MPSNNAEKCKNYRNRKKDAALKIKTTPKTPAERSRMYRLRKKQLAQGSKLSANEVLYTPSASNSQMTFEPSPQPVTTITSLQDEFKRLSNNRLLTISKDIQHFINQKKGLTMYTFNSQSLRAHSGDLIELIVQKSQILMLSETWLSDNESISIPNYNCIIQYKRSNVRAEGVAIYHNVNDTTNIVTATIDMTVKQSDFVTSATSSVGEFCIAECKTEDGKKIVLIAIYISPNQKIEDIIHFLKRTLFPYTTVGGICMGKGEDKLPLILSGDFNNNFNTENAGELINFLREDLNLSINKDSVVSTTRDGTTIDTVFVRYLDNISTRPFVSYLSYQKSLVAHMSTELQTIDVN